MNTHMKMHVVMYFHMKIHVVMYFHMKIHVVMYFHVVQLFPNAQSPNGFVSF